MDAIKSLDGLVEILKQTDANDYVKIAKNMCIPVSDFNNYTYWKDDGYTRNCILKTAQFELILICWKENDFTPIHGHDNQKCWVYQVDGKMTEIRYELDSKGNFIECHQIQLEPGSLTYMHDSMGYHLLKNNSTKKAMTLHLYISPIDSCEVYNDKKKCFEKIALSFDSINGKIKPVI